MSVFGGFLRGGQQGIGRLERTRTVWKTLEPLEVDGAFEHVRLKFGLDPGPFVGWWRFATVI